MGCRRGLEEQEAKEGTVLSQGTKRIITADEAGEVAIWYVETFKEQKRLKLSGPVRAITFRADGKRFAAGVHVPPREKAEERVAPHWNDRIDVYSEWEPNNWLSSSILELAVWVTVTSLAFSPDGKVLAAGKSVGLAVWDRLKLAPR